MREIQRKLGVADIVKEAKAGVPNEEALEGAWNKGDAPYTSFSSLGKPIEICIVCIYTPQLPPSALRVLSLLNCSIMSPSPHSLIYSRPL